jgi:hypothetical protein
MSTRKTSKTAQASLPFATSVITSVTFRTSVQGADRFQHYHIEATAAVAPDDNPSDVLAHLKRFVAQELKVAQTGRREEVPPPEGRFSDIFKTAHRR